jgi:DNA invertase Pin-like site-specific DNA recombinase
LLVLGERQRESPRCQKPLPLRTPMPLVVLQTSFHVWMSNGYALYSFGLRGICKGESMRTYQPRATTTHQQSSMGWGHIELDTNAGLGIYARQSTLAQVKNYRQSTEMQTDDLVAYAKRLGWSEEQIILFTQDLAKSGRLRIDQREGLRILIDRIETGEIKTVLVFLEDRLFRDETGIQYNVFIDVCKRHGAIVITPHMTYDFTNPFHVKQFRWRCEEAADYLRDYVIHRLHGARNRILESGKWAGRPVPIGFLVDRQEFHLIEGKAVPNPTYRKLVP